MRNKQNEKDSSILLEILDNISDIELGDEEEEIFDFPDRDNRVVRVAADKIGLGTEEFFEPYDEKEMAETESLLSNEKEVHIDADELASQLFRCLNAP